MWSDNAADAENDDATSFHHLKLKEKEKFWVRLGRRHIHTDMDTDTGEFLEVESIWRNWHQEIYRRLLSFSCSKSPLWTYESQTPLGTWQRSQQILRWGASAATHQRNKEEQRRNSLSSLSLFCFQIQIPKSNQVRDYVHGNPNSSFPQAPRNYLLIAMLCLMKRDRNTDIIYKNSYCYCVTI
jgi:hypothetical protein